MTSRTNIDRRRLWWGVTWRSVAWGLGLGSGLGAGYALLLGTPSVGSGGSGAFLITGAILGAIGGAASGVVDGIGISVLTTRSPLLDEGASQYLRTVRRTAAWCTLLTCFALWSLMLFPIALTAAGIILVWIPTAIATGVAYAIAPRVVSWYPRQDA